MSTRNLTLYEHRMEEIVIDVVYRGTAALVKGQGMCYDLDYFTSTTKQAVTDPFGGRALRTIEVPSASNRQAFAGVVRNHHPANPLGKVRPIQLSAPGGCAKIAQRVASSINNALVTCTIGIGSADNSSSIDGLFGHGGMLGRGSAIPLETLAVADEGDMPLQEITGVSVSVYAAGTDLTTFTVTTGTPGTFMGYESAAVDASDWEVTVWGGATAGDSTTERVPSGVYPIVQATGATTFTVTGDVGDGACTINIVKKNFLALAYLCDGPESGLCDIYIPYSGNSTTYISGTTGTSIVLGGLTIGSDDQSDTVVGTQDGQRKAMYMLGTLTTGEMLWDIAGTALQQDGSTTLATLEMNTAGEYAVLEWHEFGPTQGQWQLIARSASTVAMG